MNDLREKITKELDLVLSTCVNGGTLPTDFTDRYNEIVDNLEALVIGYSVDVTSDTLSDIAAVDENLEGYELQDDEAKPKVKPKAASYDFSSEKEKFIAP